MKSAGTEFYNIIKSTFMKTLSIEQMEFISAGKWQDAVGCLGGTASWIASIAALTLIPATAGLGVIAFAVFSHQANGVLMGISCGKWAASAI